MPAIGDQVASLELDHSDALAKIDTLTAQLAAVSSANTSLTSENAALNKYADEIKAMVESVASGALKMLQAARAPIVAEVESIAKTAVAEVDKVAATVKTEVTSLFPAEAAAPTDEERKAIAQQGAALLVATDPRWQNADGSQAPAPVAEEPAPVVEPSPPIAPAADPNFVERIETTAVADLKALEVKIAGVPEAVERMLHHSSAPPVTAMRAPADLTMHVDHDTEGLPIFLRRGTVFDRQYRG